MISLIPNTQQSMPVTALTDTSAFASNKVSSSHLDVVAQKAREIGITAVHLDSNVLLISESTNNSTSGRLKLLDLYNHAGDQNVVISTVYTLPDSDLIDFSAQLEQRSSPQDSAISDAESITLFTDLMAQAHELGAQDVFISLSQEADQAYCQFKVDNRLSKTIKPFHDFETGLSVCRAVYDGRETAGQSNASFNESSPVQEMQFMHTVHNQHGQIAEVYSIRFTKTVTRKVGELLVQLRLHPTTHIRTLDDLRLSKSTLRQIRHQLAKNKGMIITSGPTGSGKNGLLMAILLAYDKSTVIQTIEHPIEIPLGTAHRNIIQNSLNTDDPKSQLGALMRQAPNGIYLTEVRDEMTASFAYNVANTGHFVLTTVHANSAPNVVTRFNDLGITLKSIAADDTTALIMSQRLIKQLCNDCKKPLVLEGEEQSLHSNKSIETLTDLSISNDKFDKIFVRDEAGCQSCNHTGERPGRKLIVEIISIDDQDRRLIESGDFKAWHVQLSQKKDYHPIETQLRQLLLNGQIEPKHVLEYM